MRRARPTHVDPIRLAMPSKGHLYEGIVELLKTAGYKVRRASDRQYEATISGHPRFHVVFMRPTDIVTQVAGRPMPPGRHRHGRLRRARLRGRAGRRWSTPTSATAAAGWSSRSPKAGSTSRHVLDLVDLTTEFKAAGKTFRVSTKYPALVRQYFRRWGIYYYQLIDSEGALELHPTLGIADIIVDLTSSGTTLKDNRLREIEGGTVLDSAACLIGHAPSLAALADEGETGPLALLLDALDGVRASEGLLHLEVVGSPAAPGPRDGRGRRRLPPRAGGAAPRPGRGLGRPRRARLARHRADRRQALTACQRALLALGASRIVGLPARFVFDRDAASTFDDLRAGSPRPNHPGDD